MPINKPYPPVASIRKAKPKLKPKMEDVYLRGYPFHVSQKGEENSNQSSHDNFSAKSSFLQWPAQYAVRREMQQACISYTVLENVDTVEIVVTRNGSESRRKKDPTSPQNMSSAGLNLGFPFNYEVLHRPGSTPVYLHKASPTPLYAGQGPSWACFHFQ